MKQINDEKSQAQTRGSQMSWTRKMSITLEDLFRSNTNQFQSVTGSSNNNQTSSNSQTPVNNHSNSNQVSSTSKTHFQAAPFLQTIGRL